MSEEKPRVRVPAVMSPTADSFANVQARLGLQTQNQSAGAGYLFKNLTVNRVALEAAYETSWIVGLAVDGWAEDMTKAGIELESSLTPIEEGAIYEVMRDLLVMQDLGEAISWGRLYGGAISVMVVDGQNMATPLRIDSVGPGSFKGLMVFDRWTAIPEAGSVIKTPGPDFGLPEYYVVEANPEMGVAKRLRIHHTRVGRHVGFKLPYNRRQVYQGWGASVIERVWDRIVAFDSATTGAAQLAYKAHLRTISVEGYRELVAMGNGAIFEGFLKQMEMIRMFQNIEGLTVLDSKDKFDAYSYTFAGLDSILTEFGDQVCGAIEMPRTRVFRQSPSGMGSNGENELTTYYGDVGKKQEAHLRRPMRRLLDVICRSTLGKAPPVGFNFSFRPLWQMSDKDRSEVGAKVTHSIVEAFGAGLLTEQTAARELRGSSRVTGLFSNISDEDIAGMNDEIPDPIETAAAMAEAVGEKDPADDEDEAADA